jgi:hypothetical protein
MSSASTAKSVVFAVLRNDSNALPFRDTPICPVSIALDWRCHAIRDDETVFVDYHARPSPVEAFCLTTRKT